MILIIDDSREAATTLKFICEKAGKKAEVVHTGREGLAKVKENRYELIFCDLYPGDMDSSELLKQMPQERTVIVTGSAIKLDIDKLTNTGWNVIRKPVTRKQVLQLISEKLR